MQLIYYFVKAYMEHWNSYDNRRLGLSDLFREVGSDMKLVFQHNSETKIIQASNGWLVEQRKMGLSYYQIALQLMDKQIDFEQDKWQQLLVGVLCKVRLALCTKELDDMIKCILYATQMFNSI
mgnify:CR=1 FL=1